MAIETLSDGVLSKILHHLPFHFLLQCKSISKRFRSVISDPCFLHSHPVHCQLLPHAFEIHKSFLFFHFHSESNFHKIMLFALDSNNKTHILRGSDFLPRFWPQDLERVKVKATHYDLVLCSTHNQSYTHYFICNPFTKQYVALPPIPMTHAQEVARVGFMYDRSQSRFGVVHIPINCFEYVSSFQVNMFSSQTGEWVSFTVTIPNHKLLMSKSGYRNIIVYNEKFVWWMREHGLFVCDPFNATDSMYRIIPMERPWYFLDDGRTWDTYSGICNGRVKICSASKTSLESRIYHLVNFEQGRWSANSYHLEEEEVSMNNMNLLAFHPQTEHLVYFYSKKSIFLCDYQNQRLETVYTTTTDEDLRASDNVMTLVLPKWPTQVPKLKAAKPQK